MDRRIILLCVVVMLLSRETIPESTMSDIRPTIILPTGEVFPCTLRPEDFFRTK